MTLQQIKYVISVANKGSISAAAKELYIAQPSLTNAIRDLESELGITIFNRTNKGIILTLDGEEFLRYARQVAEQVYLLEEKYIGNSVGKKDFCLSTQHYSFAVDAFVDLIKEYGGDEYDFKLRETQTYEIIDDVSKLKSEVGILYLNTYNETIIRKSIKANDLKFTSLFKAKPHVYVSVDSPLANKESITLDDLDPYPRLSYEQGEHNSFYFSEEILSTIDRKKNILVRDRATLFNLLIGLDGYTICSGIINKKLNGENIISIPLEVDDFMELGYITHSKILPSKLAKLYIDLLKNHTISLND